MLSLASYCEKSILLVPTKSLIFYFLLIEQRHRFSKMWHQFIHLISFPILKIFVHITDEYTEMMYWNNHHYIPRKDSEWGEEEEEVVARAWVCHCFWAFRTCCISSGIYCFHMCCLWFKFPFLITHGDDGKITPNRAIKVALNTLRYTDTSAINRSDGMLLPVFPQ